MNKTKLISYIFLFLLIVAAFILIGLAVSGKFNNSTNNDCPYTWSFLGKITTKIVGLDDYYGPSDKITHKRLLNYLSLSISGITQAAENRKNIVINTIINFSEIKRSDAITIYSGSDYNPPDKDGVITFSQLTGKNMADILYHSGVEGITSEYTLSFKITYDGVIVPITLITGYCLFI